MSIIAVRRNLSAGAVFFRQTGAVVEYSLDGVSWSVAFILDSTPNATINPALFDLLSEYDVDEYITSLKQTTAGTINVNNWLTVINEPQSKLDGNLCAASKALAAAAAHMINVTRETAGDDETRYYGAGATVGAGGITLLLAATPPGWIAGGVAALLAGIGAVLGLGGGIADFVSYADNTPDIDAETLGTMACKIYRAARDSGANAASLRGALSVTYGDVDAIDADIIAAYQALWDTAPGIYSTFLAYLTEIESIDCQCGQCRTIPGILFDPGATGYRSVVAWSVIQNNTRPPASNEYQLIANYTLPVEFHGRHIDTFKARFLVTGIGTEQSGYICKLTIAGPPTQSSTVSWTKAQLLAIGLGYQELTADFSAVSLINGCDALRIEYRTNYSAPTNFGLDNTCKVAFLGCEYCLRDA